MSISSIFEIIGPVMIGPSSSHTGGAYRMGIKARTLLKEEPVQIRIVLYNSYARTCQGHKTHVAILSGCLGFGPTDHRIIGSFEYASNSNIRVILSYSFDESLHPNTADIELTSTSGRSLRLRAISIGGGAIQVQEVAESHSSDRGGFYPVERKNEDFTGIEDIPVICGLESFSELLGEAENKGISLSEIILNQESRAAGALEEDILAKVSEILNVMKKAINRGVKGNVSTLGGLSGKDASLISDRKGSKQVLRDPAFSKTLAYALAVNEVNASMGVVAAAPTGGACGVLPAVLLAMAESHNLEEENIIRALVTAGGIGARIAKKTSLSASVAGCQVEVGVAVAMASGALVELLGGTPREAIEASAIGLKSYLGLACDAIAGLVEVPCIKRNAIGGSASLAAAQMALLGIKSQVPMDEVVWALADIGSKMPLCFRDTVSAGLALTETGKKVYSNIYGEEL